MHCRNQPNVHEVKKLDNSGNWHGAQLTLDELEQACAIAHARGARVYLTFNILIKPAELADALAYLGECIDRGIDAAIVQDIGIVRLIQRVYPDL